MSMLSYHNDPAVKAKYVQRFAEHRAADAVIQGQGYNEGRGCFVGCTLKDYDHSRFPEELGWPTWLAYLADKIFEGLPKKHAPQFGTDLLDAVPVGIDLEPVRARFLLTVQRRNLERLDGPTGAHPMKTISFDDTKWKLVPVEASEWVSMSMVMNRMEFNQDDWDALLAAAPQAPAHCKDCGKPAGSAGDVHTCSPQSCRSGTGHQGGRMKDHQIVKLVNDLTAVANRFAGTQQLRERLADVVVPALRPPAEMNQCDGCQRGLPVSNGLHREATGPFACTASRYLIVPVRNELKGQP